VRLDPGKRLVTREAGVRTVGPFAAAEAVAIAAGAPTAHTAASTATRAVRQALGMM
jgi:hypothetical protein